MAEAEQTATTEETKSGDDVTSTEEATTSTETNEPSTEETEREPGGSDGTAVYARKEHRRAQKLEEQLEQQRLENARYQERLRLLEEQAKEPPKTQKQELTIEQVEQAIRDGKVDPVLGSRWIARKEAEQIFQSGLRSQQEQAKLKAADSDVVNYLRVIPALRDKQSREFGDVADRLQQLVDQGLPNNSVTHRLAIELVHGPLSKFEKAKEIDRLTRENRPFHAENGAGGGRANGGTKPDWNKAPANLKAYWDEQKVSEADRQKEYAYHLRRQERLRQQGVPRT